MQTEVHEADANGIWVAEQELVVGGGVEGLGLDGRDGAGHGEGICVGVTADDHQPLVGIDDGVVLAGAGAVGLPLAVVVEVGLPTVGGPYNDVVGLAGLAVEDFVGIGAVAAGAVVADVGPACGIPCAAGVAAACAVKIVEGERG